MPLPNKAQFVDFSPPFRIEFSHFTATRYLLLDRTNIFSISARSPVPANKQNSPKQTNTVLNTPLPPPSPGLRDIISSSARRDSCSNSPVPTKSSRRIEPPRLFVEHCVIAKQFHRKFQSRHTCGCVCVFQFPIVRPWQPFPP